ncbi:MAG TPA: methyltransferase domain-containing protein [Thermoanaerobaculia bacterium]|nr:methyltransferase domain-containing protein [Thermoanaerobaculia bacterium]
MSWTLACPVCRTTLDAGRCSGCGRTWEQVDGIWRFLPPEREAVFAPFLRDYTRIRHAEGRGSDDPEHYLRLPDCDPSHPIAWQWQMRRRTWETFRSQVLPRLGPKILDLGAGVGWLSHRLADLGHQPCAVDVSVDERDGLAAARHYRSGWPRLQAELDHLPLAGGQADAVVYNASLHYSPDYAVTLREALRVLRPGGSVVILESPIYRREESGRRMVAERHADFERRFGTRSDALPSIEYLTWERLGALARDLGLRWRKVPTWYGWRWAMRPWVARLKRKREPSRFVILVGTKGSPAADRAGG